KKKPFFLKMLFNSNRFIILLFVCSVYYTSNPAYIEDVKRRCNRTDLVSLNSINSFIMMLRTFGLMKVEKSTYDNRKLIYNLSDKAVSEAISLIDSMAIPLKEIFGIEYAIESKCDLRKFFVNYSEIIFSGNFMHIVHAESSVFIMRDSGHMIILNIYRRYLMSKSTYFDFDLAGVARECGVSRTHLKRCLDDAENVDLLYLYPYRRKIAVTSKFIDIASHYMAIYLSAIHFGFCHNA
ncbi:TPA: hypothetical protein ACXJEC_004726, partial [Serratia marcescens]